MMELNGKTIDTASLHFDGYDFDDYPDFCDVYLDYAEFVDGVELTDNELELLENKYPEELYQHAINQLM